MAIATLPIVLAVVLTELAVGGAFLLWFIDRGGRAPSGFLKLVAFVDAGAMAAALALVPTFPRGDLAETAGGGNGTPHSFRQGLGGGPDPRGLSVHHPVLPGPRVGVGG